jgi:hypothetical protein
VFDQISSKEKVFINVLCASHFMLWEKQRHVLHKTSLEWLRNGSVKNVNRGEFRVDENGAYRRVTKITK